MRLVDFFFQAEDGIRYLVRSRGLGDVYKRQVDHSAKGNFRALGKRFGKQTPVVAKAVAEADAAAVSYTHLTLPTSDLV